MLCNPSRQLQNRSNVHAKIALYFFALKLSYLSYLILLQRFDPFDHLILNTDLYLYEILDNGTVYSAVTGKTLKIQYYEDEDEDEVRTWQTLTNAILQTLLFRYHSQYPFDRWHGFTVISFCVVLYFILLIKMYLSRYSSVSVLF